MDDLPLDLVLHIFSMLPIKSLFQLRCVSKLWHSIVDHHLCSATDRVPMLLLLVPHNKTMTFHLVQEKGRTLKASENSISTLSVGVKGCILESSCNGLLCISYNKKQGFILLNPLINDKQFLSLPMAPLNVPSPSHTMVSCGLGYDASANTYKIVRIVCQDLELNVYRTQVCVLGSSSWSWREIDEIPPYPVHGKPVFSHGALYWLVSPYFMRDDDGNAENLKVNMILCFDVVKEKFGLTPNPDFDCKDFALFDLLDVNGNLGIVDLSSSTDIDIWVLSINENTNEGWRREYRIEFHAAIGRPDNGQVRVTGVCEDGEVLLKSDEGFFIYNPKSGLLRYVQSLGLESDSAVLQCHRGSLISVANFNRPPTPEFSFDL
ncbi:hypothetical protein NMG60_11033659 [Bertholletia excelsa]